ncbi:hypothetical protein DAMA08_029070 [Martiniozyma asiatica (nom. inval.)]|nr:hypothetical protein DAMA08_029070 [Martiniozyma asiatica]
MSFLEQDFSSLTQQAMDYIHKNPSFLPTVGCLAAVSTLVWWIGSAPSKGKPKRVQPKPKPRPKPLTPKETIDQVMKKFNELYLPLVISLKSTVVERLDQLQHEEFNADNLKDGKSYKDALQYQALYLEESLLKLIMTLDGVEHNGDEEIKNERKKAIKIVQAGHNEVDNLSQKIKALNEQGVEF